jgi:predicted small metal-binding protein
MVTSLGRCQQGAEAKGDEELARRLVDHAGAVSTE